MHVYTRDTAQANDRYRYEKLKLMVQRDLERRVRESHLHARNKLDHPWHNSQGKSKKEGERQRSKSGSCWKTHICDRGRPSCTERRAASSVTLTTSMQGTQPITFNFSPIRNLQGRRRRTNDSYRYRTCGKTT